MLQQLERHKNALVERLVLEEAETRDFVTDEFEDAKTKKDKFILAGKGELETFQNALMEGFELIINDMRSHQPHDATVLEFWLVANAEGIERSMTEAFLRVRDGATPEMASTLQETLQLTDNLLAAMYSSARRIAEGEHREDAVKAFSILPLLNSHVECFWVDYGLSLFEVQQFETALYAYGMASALNEKSPYPLAYSGQCYAAMNMLQDAEEEFKGAIDLCGDNEEHKDLRAFSSSELEMIHKR